MTLTISILLIVLLIILFLIIRISIENKLSKTKDFSKIQPYLYLSPQKSDKYFAYVNKKGDVTVSFRLTLPEVHTMQGDDFDRLHKEMNRIIAELPDGVSIHKQDFFFRKRYAGSKLDRQNLLYVEHEKYFSQREFLDCESYIHLTLSSTSLFDRKINYTIFALKGNANFISPKNTANFFACLDKFQIQIGKLGIPCHALDKQETLRVVNMHFQFQQPVNVKPDISFDDDLIVGSKKLDVYSITSAEQVPAFINNTITDGTYSTDDSSYIVGMLYPLCFNLPCDHEVNTIIHKVDVKEMKTRIKAENDHKVKLFKQMGNLNIKIWEDNEAYIADCDNEALNCCKLHFNVITACNEDEDRTKLRVAVEEAFSSLEMTANHNLIRAGNVYWGSAPGNSADMPTDLCIPTFIQVATCFFNWESNYRTALDGILLYDRISQVPVVVDLWSKPYADKVISNRNALLLGFSGEGKSVLLNHIFSQYLEQDYSLVVLDIGDSYKKLCMLYGGLYFKYEVDKPLFNPFQCPGNDPDVEFLESLCDLIFVAWYRGVKDPEPKTESVVKECLQAYYEYLRNNPSVEASFDSFFDFYKNERLEKDRKLKDSTFDTEDFLLVMKEFTTGNMYGNVFNGTVSIDIDKHNFIIFELDNVKDNKVLFPIVAHMITHTVNNTIFKKIGKKKAVWVDEAWKVLENPGMRAFLKYLYKTIRKKEGQVGIAVQDITDIPNNEIGTTIINNSAIKWFMPHVKNKNSVPIVGSRCSLTETALTQLYGIKSDVKIGHYTEFMIVLGNESKPYRLELTPYSYYAFTSNESENVELYELAEQNDGSMKTAIIKMIDKHKKK